MLCAKIPFPILCFRNSRFAYHTQLTGRQLLKLADARKRRDELSAETDLNSIKKRNHEIQALNRWLDIHDEIIRKQQGLKEIKEMRDMGEHAGDAAFVTEVDADYQATVAALGDLEKQLVAAMVPRHPSDSRNAILEVRAGTGGQEAALFAADLLKMYERFSQACNWKFEILDIQETDLGGFREASASVAGTDVFRTLKHESGVHRVQRVPVTEGAGRVHTSTATVAVLPEAEDVDVNIRSEDLRIDTFRSGGKGGQSVNKTESAIRITHLPSGTVVQCQDERSQHKNKARAMKILRARIFDQQQSRLDAERAAMRSEKVGTGARNERIRTYNYAQDRTTDHRIGVTLHGINRMMTGTQLAALTEQLNAHFDADLESDK